MSAETMILIAIVALLCFLISLIFALAKEFADDWEAE